jgi:hypothetical protein
MPAVNRLILVIAAVALAGCAAEPDKQWYKASSYTVAEFQRDRDACTKNGVLDEPCLRQRGWIPLSADKEKPVQPPEPVKGRY